VSGPERQRIVSWQDPLVGAALGAQLSGLEYLRAMADGRIPPPPLGLLLGMDVAQVDPGHVVFSLDIGEHLYNPIGTVHGGALCALLDSAMGCAVHSTLAVGHAYTTLEIKVNLVKALTLATPTVLAEGDVITAGRRVATASGRVVDAGGTLYAHATTTCLIMQPPPTQRPAPPAEHRPV
jgi:uncharacterized protein (TIGR00369 family)